MRAFMTTAFILSFMASQAAAQGDAFVIGAVSIYFRSDGQDAAIPSDVIERVVRVSSGASPQLLGAEIVHALGETKLHKDIVVEMAPLPNNRTALLVSARSAWRINSLRVENSKGVVEDFNKYRVFISSHAEQHVSSFLSLDYDAHRIEKALRAEGYLKARVRYSVRERTKGKIDVVFVVERGNPCLVADFVPRGVPIRVFRSLASGDLCNAVSIANKLKEEEARLRNQGFVSARIQFDPESDLIPSKDLERASLHYTYVPGERWSLSVIDRDTGANIEEDFMRGTGFVLADMAFSSPEEIEQNVLSYLRSQGYADAVVTQNNLAEDGGEKKLVLEVDRGRWLFVDAEATEFLGDLPISRDEAISALGVRPGFWNAASGVPFVEKELERKRVGLSEHLVNMGYVDSVVSLPEVQRFPGSDRVVLRVQVRPGFRYRVQKVLVAGKPTSFDSDESLVKEFFEAKSVLQPRLLSRFQSVVLSELQLAGYRKAQVSDPEISCRGKKAPAGSTSRCAVSPQGEIDVDVSISVEAGPLFRIGKVLTSDTPFGKDDSLLQASGLVSGDVLSAKALSDARARILKHGLFGSVIFEGVESLSLSEEEKKEKEVFRDIKILVLQQRNWNLTLNPSWNSDRGYGFTTNFQRNNLTADGLQFLFNSRITQEPYQSTASNGPGFGQVPGLSLSAGLREAFFRAGPFHTPLDFNFITVGQEVDVRDERRTTTHFQSDIAWRPFWFGMEFAHKFEVSYAFSGYPLGGVSKPVKLIDNSNNVGVVEVAASTAVDTRSNPVWPTRGYTASFGFARSHETWGSDVSYDRWNTDLSLFFPLTRSWTQALSFGGRKVSSVTAPGNRREKISSAQVRGFPAMDSQMGPLLWYLEKDSAGNCVAKLSQSAATNLYTSRAELRYRQSQSSWGATLFYDTANSYFSPGEIARLNSQLAALSADAGDNCPSSAARVIGNDAIRFAPTTKKFWEDSISGSYQSVGVGYRLFLADMFSLNLDWGVPVYDPNGNDKECVSFSDPYASRGTATSAPTPPTCISRKPQYLREWDSVSNGLFNVFGFLKRTQISIEGKF